MDYDGDKGVDDASHASGLGDDVEPMEGKLDDRTGKVGEGRWGAGRKDRRRLWGEKVLRARK